METATSQSKISRIDSRFRHWAQDFPARAATAQEKERALEEREENVFLRDGKCPNLVVVTPEKTSDLEKQSRWRSWLIITILDDQLIQSFAWKTLTSPSSTLPICVLFITHSSCHLLA